MLPVDFVFPHGHQYFVDAESVLVLGVKLVGTPGKGNVTVELNQPRNYVGQGY